MQDMHARQIRYLRLSVTPDCHMRCMYCRPAGPYVRDGGPLLSAGELVQLASHLVRRHGVRKVRLTGGEPTARGDLAEIISRLSSIDGLEELAMTTNGLTLARDAALLRRKGLKRVNVSLDSLDAAVFAAITGANALHLVLEGISAALAAGLPVKLNCVVLRGRNLDELPRLVAWAAARSLEIRFIELMPMGPLAGMWRRYFVSEAEMRRVLETCVAQWRPLARTTGAARRWEAVMHSGARTVVGFISAMSCPFCDRCDRLRIGADGSVYPCLMDRPAGTLLEAVRPVFDADRVDALLARWLRNKAAQHGPAGCGIMTGIGG